MGNTAIGHLRDLIQFAYEKGFHELGYDPLAAMETSHEAAREFCRWYDEYQTEYARFRVRAALRSAAGLDDEPFPNKSTMNCYNKMIAAYEALHIAATGEGRPNYVERANPKVKMA